MLLTEQGKDKTQTLCPPLPPPRSPQVWAWPVLHLVQEPHPQAPVFPRGQLCLIDFETATVKQLIKTPQICAEVLSALRGCGSNERHSS